MTLNTPMVRYSSFVFALVATFTNFVACGARMYQVSLNDDYTPPPSAGTQGLGGGTHMSGAPGDPIHTRRGWGQNLPIPFQFSTEMDQNLRQHMLSAMSTWEKAVGKKLFRQLPHSDPQTGDDFPQLYSSLSDMINGHYITHDWHKTTKSRDVIATTIWDSTTHPQNPTEPVINKADILFNFRDYNIGDSFTLLEEDSRVVVDMESLALHELGHLLGLAHIGENIDPHSIMNPALLIGEGLASRKVSRGDIERIQKIYSCQGIACDIDTIHYQLETGTAVPPLPPIDQNQQGGTETTQY